MFSSIITKRNNKFSYFNFGWPHNSTQFFRTKRKHHKMSWIFGTFDHFSVLGEFWFPRTKSSWALSGDLRKGLIQFTWSTLCVSSLCITHMPIFTNIVTLLSPTSPSISVFFLFGHFHAWSIGLCRRGILLEGFQVCRWSWKYLSSILKLDLLLMLVLMLNSTAKY